jgi:hypothetical protein
MFAFSIPAAVRSLFNGLTSARLNRSGRKNARATARISPVVTCRTRRFTSAGWKIRP